MSYIYEIDAKAVFESRFDQFVAFGIARTQVEAVQAAITDMWTDVPGGWPYEWSAVARTYMEQGNPFLASIAYGYAKFPCLADDTRRKALDNQVAAYLAAAPGFPIKFERRTIALPYRGASVDLPVHLFSMTGEYDNAPVLIFSGGVDTYKMDCHDMCVTLARRAGVTVLAFDMPGTAENPVPLSSDGDEMVLGLVEEARRIGNGKVAHFGMSFGGNFSAMTGLSGAVDAAINLGGPVERCFDVEHIESLPFRTADIIGNDMGFDHQPGAEELGAAMATLLRRSLLDRADNAPMLVINGADDPLIPQADTLVFEGRANTEVHLLPDTGHCAVSKLGEVLDLTVGWLPAHLGMGVAAQTARAVDARLATPLPVAPAASVGFDPERLARMDGAMRAEIDAGHYAGISVMVARHGKLVKFGRYGYQSLEGRAPLREDAIYRIASMTKPIIAVAMMTLYEEGKWQLDDPVTKFIPEFADLKVMRDGELVPLDRPITMRHIMSTSAGFAFGPAMGSSNPEVDALYAAAELWSGTNDEMIAKLAKLPLESQPGTRFRYGLQQEVQGVIIRRISGEALDAFLERRVFRPLRMKDTGFGVPEGHRDRIAPRYTVDANLKLVLAADQSPFPAVAGTPAGVTPRMLLSIAGLYSTAQDYMRFAQMLANGGQLDGVRVLSPSSVKLMTSNQLAEGVPVHFDQPFAGVGYGMNLGIVLDPARADFNGGGLGAGSFYWGGVHGTWFWIDPVNDLVVVGMVQQESAGNPPTGRPYPMPDIRGISRSITYGALVDPAA
jgi:CubicO group peptidase (beta-lactamase class C family)